MDYLKEQADMTERTSLTRAELFWAKVDKSGECWLWTGALSPKGYGRFNAGGGNIRFAHRWVYEHTFGPLAPNLQVDHRCHARRCVNPAHLQAVDQSANMQNRRGANRQSATGIRGVSYEPRVSKFQVQVWADGKMHREYHATIEAAEIAAIALRNRLMTNNLLDRTP